MNKMKIYLALSLILYVTSQKFGYIRFTADDAITNIKINDIDLDLSTCPNKANWPSFDVLNLPKQLSPGDKITLVGLNKGTFTYGNPGNIIAEIVYWDLLGLKQRIVTGIEKWRCNGGPPLSYGTLLAERPNQNIPDAEWIWSRAIDDSVATCSTYIPLENKVGIRLNMNKSVCVPNNYTSGIETIERATVEYLCNFVDMDDNIISPNQISQMVHEGKLNITFNKGGVKPSVIYNVSYLKDDTTGYTKVSISVDKKMKMTQTVRYQTDGSVQLKIGII